MNDSSHWSAPIQVARWVLNTLFHQILAVIAIYTIWVPIEQNSEIPAGLLWHIILCTLGLIPLAAQGIIIYFSDNVWLQGIEKKTKAILHGCLMGMSVVLIIAGISVEINRGSNTVDYSHFSGAHGITGLVFMILVLLAVPCGICAKFAQGLKGFLRPVIIKFVHNLWGQVTFIFGIVCFCCGFYTTWFQSHTSQKSRTTATVTTAIIAVWTLVHAIVSAVKHIRAIMNVEKYRGVPLVIQGINRPLSIVKLSTNEDTKLENDP